LGALLADGMPSRPENAELALFLHALSGRDSKSPSVPALKRI
jgi:hypothetical protein